MFNNLLGLVLSEPLVPDDNVKVERLPIEVINLILDYMEINDKVELMKTNHFFHQLIIKQFYSNLEVKDLNEQKKQSYLKHFKLINKVIIRGELDNNDIEYLMEIFLIKEDLVSVECNIDLLFNNITSKQFSHFNIVTLNIPLVNFNINFKNNINFHYKQGNFKNIKQLYLTDVSEDIYWMLDHFENSINELYFSNLQKEMDLKLINHFIKFNKLKGLFLTGIISIDTIQHLFNFNHEHLKLVKLTLKVINMDNNNLIILDGNKLISLLSFTLISRGISIEFKNSFLKLKTISLDIDHLTSFNNETNIKCLELYGIDNLVNLFKVKLDKKLNNKELAHLFSLKQVIKINLISVNSIKFPEARDLNSNSSNPLQFPIYPLLQHFSNVVELVFKYNPIDNSFFNLLFSCTKLNKLILFKCAFNPEEVLLPNKRYTNLRFIWITKCHNINNFVPGLVVACPNLLDIYITNA